MEKKVMLVCVTVGFLGFLTAIMGFGEEGNNIKASEVYLTTDGSCSYSRRPVLALGLIASVALVIAQAIISISAGCICCKRNRHSLTCGSTACFIFSWFTFVIAFFLLLTGSVLLNLLGLTTQRTGINKINKR